MIKIKIDPQSKFSFNSVQYEDVLRKIKGLNVSKSSQQSDIRAKTLIENGEYFTCYFLENINNGLSNSLLFSLDLKLAETAPVYKEKSKSSKDKHH